MSRSAARITCPAQQRTKPPFPLQCLLLSVASPPPFRRFRGSDPLLPAEQCSVAHRVRPLVPPVSPCSAPLLSVPVAGATGGLTLLCQNWQQRVRPTVALRCTNHLPCTEATAAPFPPAPPSSDPPPPFCHHTELARMPPSAIWTIDPKLPLKAPKNARYSPKNTPFYGLKNVRVL